MSVRFQGHARLLPLGLPNAHPEAPRQSDR